MIKVPKEIEELAQIFYKNKVKLYLVGGYVRNQILGFPDSYNIDIDICSSMPAEKIIKMLEDTGFEVNYMNKELGVVEIKRNIRVEHATFRKEKYAMPGVHIPDNIEFIKDLETDAKRRDFTCNALYYDIIDKELVDPFDGRNDIKNKVIKTTLEPQKVFKDDAERILRMVRFASTLGFEIERQTYEAAKENVYKLERIGSGRKREEFSRIVLADTKFDFLTDIKYAHARGLNILADLGALKYLLPTLEEIKNSDIKEDRGKPLFEHILNVFAFSAPEVRLSALLHDVGKFETYKKYKNFQGSNEITPVLIEKNLGNETLDFSKRIIERVKKVVLGQEFNRNGFASTTKIKRFIVENEEEIELIIALKNAVALDKSWFRRDSISARRIHNIYDKMIQSNTPLSIDNLKIDGHIIVELFPEIDRKRIKDINKALLYKCLDKPSLNNREDLIKQTIKIVKRNKKAYLGE